MLQTRLACQTVLFLSLSVLQKLFVCPWVRVMLQQVGSLPLPVKLDDYLGNLTAQGRYVPA